MTITSEIYLIANGWEIRDGQWFQLSGWPDGLDTETAMAIQRARDQYRVDSEIID